MLFGYYKNLYERDPTDVGAALGLVSNLRYLGRVEQAQAVAWEVLARDPEAQPIVAELGKAQLAAGHVVAAIETLLHALNLAPNDWRARSALGVALDMSGDHKSAQSAYHEALALADGEISLLNNLALSKALAGDLPGAIEKLEEATLKPLATVQVRQNLALLLALNGNVEAAGSLIRDSLPSDMVENNMNYFTLLGSAKSIAP